MNCEQISVQTSGNFYKDSMISISITVLYFSVAKLHWSKICLWHQADVLFNFLHYFECPKYVPYSPIGISYSFFVGMPYNGSFYHPDPIERARGWYTVVSLFYDLCLWSKICLWHQADVLFNFLHYFECPKYVPYSPIGISYSFFVGMPYNGSFYHPDPIERARGWYTVVSLFYDLCLWPRLLYLMESCYDRSPSLLPPSRSTLLIDNVQMPFGVCQARIG